MSNQGMTAQEIYNWRREFGFYADSYDKGRANADYIRAEVAAGRLKPITHEESGITWIEFVRAGK